MKQAMLFTLVLVTACGNKKDDAPANAKPTEPTTAAATAPASASTKIDLGKAGDAWKGFSVQAATAGEVSDTGGGVAINFTDNTMLPLSVADSRDVKQLKTVLAANNKTVTYTSDTNEDLSYTTVTDMGGNLITGYGFSVLLAVGGKKIECGSTYDDHATANRMKEICRSLSKQ